MPLSSAPMTMLPHSAWPPKASLAKKNTSNGTPSSLSGNWRRKSLRNAPRADSSRSMATCITARLGTMTPRSLRPKSLRPESSTWTAKSKILRGAASAGYAPPFFPPAIASPRLRGLGASASSSRRLVNYQMTQNSSCPASRGIGRWLSRRLSQVPV
jgi:hypothetical protein